MVSEEVTTVTRTATGTLAGTAVIPPDYANPPGIGFWRLVREDYHANGSDWHTLGFRALLVHRFGRWRMGIGSPLLRMPLSVLYRTLYRYVRNHYGIEISLGASIGRRVAIDHQSGIVITGYCRIGDDCRLRHNTTIGIKTVDDLRAPTLGRGVDIGTGAVLLGGIRVGDGAAIGANAVVLQDVPDGALAVGVPARVVTRSADGVV
jgi:serine O-acetyltransferase